MLPISALYRSRVELRPSEAAERRIRRQGLQLYQAARIKLQPHFTFHIHTSHSAVDREQVASPLLSCGLTKANVNAVLLYTFMSLTPRILDEDVIPEHLAGVRASDLVDCPHPESVSVFVLQRLNFHLNNKSLIKTQSLRFILHFAKCHLSVPRCGLANLKPVTSECSVQRLYVIS